MAGPVAVVVDASLVASLVIETPYSRAARALVPGWQEAGATLYAPVLLEYEVTSVLRKSVAGGVLPAARAEAALAALSELSIVRVSPDADSLLAALRWAARLGQRAAYDAQYLALAERLGAEFYTADRRLASLAEAAGLPWVRSILSTA